VVLDTKHPDMTGIDTSLDAYVFVTGSALVKNVMVAGEIVASDRRHKQREPIAARYRSTIEKLSS
jgi:formimidoylglutamate deiminase